MKLSELWLREWVNPALKTEQLAEQLSLAGLEVAAMSPVAGAFSQVIVGQIVALAPHPDASRLQVCQVDVGAKEDLTIVCGAKNPRVGLKVAVAQVGAQLPNDLHIKVAKLRGVVSQGMLCSASELGLSDTGLEAGILELPEEAPIGKDLRDYLQLNDHCLDVHITPNRGDCLSVKGLARDVAAITGAPLTSPPISNVAAVIADKYDIQVESAQDCPHYSGRIIRHIKQQATTPLWLSERLRRSGLRTIHPVVDICNYVMLELGQPLHAFDLAQLSGGIQVRRAHADEEVTLLDGKKVILDKASLVIADKVQVQAIAGIMGAAYSAVSATSQDIFIESAFFNPTVIAGRARQYGLNTDAAYRFERGVDPALTRVALERATELLVEIVGGKAGPVVHIQHAPAKVAPIPFHLPHLKKLLGISLCEEEMAAIFKALGISFVAKQALIWQVTPPTWRFDLALEADLMEELARIHGYQHILPVMPNAELHFLPQQETKLPLRRLRHLLIDKGYHETINYSFTAPSLQHLIAPQSSSLHLLNPISSELAVMRSSLWPGLLNSLSYNQQRQQLNLRLFESGLCFQISDGKLEQIDYLAGIASGNKLPEQWGVASTDLDFFTVKSDIEALVHLMGKSATIQFMPGTHPALHPGQSSTLQQAGNVIGHFGALHPQLIADLDLIGPVYLFELKTSALTSRNLPQFKAFSKFPIVRRDISFWLSEEYAAQTILDKIHQIGGDWLNRAYLFDVYHAAAAEKKRSLALALYWQHPSRTLVDAEVDALVQKVIEGLKQSFAIQLRD
ncbi:MAG: phenylalanine--tRNA ligase beta subunit [Pseudomonadota bacterium]|jgi:phenylalanyl-tRNA synthetase beta chain